MEFWGRCDEVKKVVDALVLDVLSSKGQDSNDHINVPSAVG